MRPEAQAWWDLAQTDFETAKTVLDVGAYYMTAFLSQQSAEKAMKAVWMVRNRRNPPKTHNLLELAGDLSIADEFDTALRRLNPEYVATRYPDAANGVPALNYNLEIAQELLDFSAEIMTWCRNQLEPS
jgi:HEPN domain-containing protein